MKSAWSTSAANLGLLMKGRSARDFTVFCVVLLGLASFAFGQDATIVGTVTDPSGSVIANVAITLTQTNTGQVRSLKTNDAGQYVAPDLGIGNYVIRAETSGFKVEEKKGIVLNVGDRARIDFAMQVGSTQESVTVEADAVKVQADSGEVSGVITGNQLTQLATNGRSIYTLVNLTPGVSNIQGDFIAPTSITGDQNVSINGSRPINNLYMIDGGEDNDRGGGGYDVLPSLDAIAEFRTLTSNYSAEYGLTAGGVITQVFKSGTQQFHASAWEFDRNDALDARNYFNRAPAPVTELRFNTYGFNAGGKVPLWKSHPTFFFYNMEWRSLINGGSLNQNFPATSSYGGDFSQLDTPLTAANLHVPCANQLSTTQQSNFNAAGITTFSTPGTGGACTAAAGALFQTFTNNIIPSSLINPISTTLLKAGIFPNTGNSGVFQGGNSSPTNVREEIVRIDHTFSDKFSVFGHFVAEQATIGFGTTQWSGDNSPSVGDTMANPSYSGVVHTTYVISPTLLNEASFNYNGNRINITPTGTFALPNGYTPSRIFGGPPGNIPSINLGNNPGAGGDYTSNWTPWSNIADDYQLRDDVSLTRGAHQIKIGGSWALWKKSQSIFTTPQGNFDFSGGSFTGNGFSDFLLGYAGGYSEDAVKDSGQYNNVSWAAYVQDNWRVNHRLTLNLGVRWDGVPHTYEANDRLGNFYPNLYTPVTPAQVLGAGNSSILPGAPGLGTSPNPILANTPIYLNGIGIPGKNGVPNDVVNNHWAAFAPRLGFAYDLTGAGKTVIRGGFGINYSRIQGNDMYNAGGNSPFNTTAGLSNVLLSDPQTGVLTDSPVAIPVVDLTGLDQSNYKLPVTYQYNLGVQRALGTKSVLSVAYVGNQSRHLNDYRQINLPAFSDLPGLVSSNNAGNLYNTDVPYVGYRSIRMSEDEANGHYNSLQTDLHATVRKDVQLQFGYTYSKTIDPTIGQGSGADLQNVTNPYVGWRYDQGPSIYDRTHVAFANFVYDLPIFRDSPNRLLNSTVGGWQLSGIVTMESGAPLNITLGGTSAGSIVQQSGNRPNAEPITYPHTTNEWFDPSVFTTAAAIPAPGTWGTLGHNAIRGPGRDNWNLALFKTFAFTERAHFELRIETFNTWNHTQFRGDANGGGIDINTTDSRFGQVTAAFDPRVFQLGGKLIF
jgi:hypothetical protein